MSGQEFDNFDGDVPVDVSQFEGDLFAEIVAQQLELLMQEYRQAQQFLEINEHLAGMLPDTDLDANIVSARETMARVSAQIAESPGLSAAFARYLNPGV